MITLVLAALLQGTPVSGISTCSVQREADHWRGQCRALIEGADATLDLAPARAVTTGQWRRDAQPVSVWSGTVAANEVPPTPVEIEIYADHRGVMRSAFGWFVVDGLTTAHEGMRIDVDAEREAPPSTVDRDIVEHARRILATDAVWNRADNRQCPAAAASWSIYCAMQKATTEVAGAFHHRRPALQVVRAIVDERTAGRPYDHRLMDYNNDPTTSLTDVKSLFDEALRRIDAQRAAATAR